MRLNYEATLDLHEEIQKKIVYINSIKESVKTPNLKAKLFELADHHSKV